MKYLNKGILTKSSCHTQKQVIIRGCCGTGSKSVLVGIMMWEKHFPRSHFTFRWNWIRPTGSAAETQKKKKKKPSAIFSLMLFFFFGNYPGGFEVLIRQCWLIPAVHNLCYYWMITRDKRGREREREDLSADTNISQYQHFRSLYCAVCVLRAHRGDRTMERRRPGSRLLLTCMWTC